MATEHVQEHAHLPARGRLQPPPSGRCGGRGAWMRAAGLRRSSKRHTRAHLSSYTQNVWRDGRTFKRQIGNLQAGHGRARARMQHHVLKRHTGPHHHHLKPPPLVSSPSHSPLPRPRRQGEASLEKRSGPNSTNASSSSHSALDTPSVPLTMHARMGGQRDAPIHETRPARAAAATLTKKNH